MGDPETKDEGDEPVAQERRRHKGAEGEGDEDEQELERSSAP